MIAYFDLVSGISGDIVLGCLVDAGWDVRRLREVVAGLGLGTDEWSIEARTVKRGPIAATRVDVHAAVGRHHRHLRHIRVIIEKADLADVVKTRAIAVFERLARAEAKVHGSTPERIHFHEVGAVDAIIDIVGAIAGLADLGVDRVFCSTVPLGDGWAETEHGRIPLPAPATMALLAEAGAPTRPAFGPGEWVTPTGAALMTELATFSQPAMALAKLGTGAGGREAPWPNVARLWIGHPPAESHAGLVQLDTNIDDMNPQLYPAVAERLFASGARDVWLTPIQMKKGRPGVMLSAIAAAADEPAVSEVMLRETTTLGVRVHSLSGRHGTRHELHDVTTPFGPIAVKVKWVGNTPVGGSPEYEACVAAARQHGVAVKTVLEAAQAASVELVGKLPGARE